MNVKGDVNVVEAIRAERARVPMQLVHSRGFEVEKPNSFWTGN